MRVAPPDGSLLGRWQYLLKTQGTPPSAWNAAPSRNVPSSAAEGSIIANTPSGLPAMSATPLHRGSVPVAMVSPPKSTMPAVATSNPMTSALESESKSGEGETTPTVNAPVARAKPTKAVKELTAPARP